jgi:hypothetical protein
MTDESLQQKKRKDPIYQSLRQTIWVSHMGRVFEGKCPIPWCVSIISVFNFECGHNIPESRGGATDVSNLIPICGSCNKGMGNRYTIDEWSKMYPQSAPVTSTIHITGNPIDYVSSTQTASNAKQTCQTKSVKRFFSCFSSSAR